MRQLPLIPDPSGRFLMNSSILSSSKVLGVLSVVVNN